MLTRWRLIDVQNGRTVVESLELADNYWSRLVGWQLRPAPAPGRGLLLVPCASVHTCFLRFVLDLAMLDREGTVLAVRQGVRPWRAVFAPPKTHAVLEFPSPGPELRVGHSLALGPCTESPESEAHLPKSLQFLDKA